MLHFLLISIINYVKEDNPPHFHILHLNEMLTTHRLVISSFIFKSELCHFNALVKLLQNVAMGMETQ